MATLEFMRRFARLLKPCVAVAEWAMTFPEFVREEPTSKALRLLLLGRVVTLTSLTNRVPRWKAQGPAEVPKWAYCGSTILTFSNS